MSSAAEKKIINKKGLISWCLYDWANSAFPTVITTFVFAAYFTKGVATDEISGTSQWGYALSLSAIAIAVVGPVLGAIADKLGRRKPWIFFFTVLTAVSCVSLWWVKPDSAFVVQALVAIVLANFSFEMGVIFYNALLPTLSPREYIGRWSGWGWGLGYGGGLLCLALVLVGFVQAEQPWFGLNKNAAEHLRVTGPIVAFWMMFFAWPLFIFIPDEKRNAKNWLESITDGIGDLKKTLQNISHYRNVAWFLFARMMYTDGLNTLFAFGGIYAAATFGLTFSELIIFGISLNVTAGIGALVFAWFDDYLGAKRTIISTIISLIVVSVIILIIENKMLFWIFGVSLGFFVGPAQSASRSMIARLAPVNMRAEFFGLYAFSGKATAFLGPAAVAFFADIYQSQRIGMATVVVFLVIGLLLMRKVPDIR
ncbi:MAG: MFS transporter [Magnetovibrio sp.]|nr:MFS transporter [Magnetovibrio sp.]